MALVSPMRVGITGGSTGGNMAATNGGGGSRLAQMQARLQERLMVEKESRLLEMAARHEAQREGTIRRVTGSSASSLSSSLSSIGSTGQGQGRVRKLFEDRRSNGYNHHSPVGWDKSYPLEPVRGAGSGGTGRPPPGGGRQTKGIVRSNRGASMDRAPQYQDTTAMKRSRSHATLQRAVDPRTAPRNNMRPPIGRTLNHHKSTSSLLDANQNYSNSNGRGSSGSSSGIYSREHSRDTSPASSPPPPANRFGYRPASRDRATSRDRASSRGPSPSPPQNRSPRKSIPSLGTQRNSSLKRNSSLTRNNHSNSQESMTINTKSAAYQYQQSKRNSFSNDNYDQDNRSSQNRMPQKNQYNKENRYNQDNQYYDDSQDHIPNGNTRRGSHLSRSNSSEQEYDIQDQRNGVPSNTYEYDTGEQYTSMRNKTNNHLNSKPKQPIRTPSKPLEQPPRSTARPVEKQQLQKRGNLFNSTPTTDKAEDVVDAPPKPPIRSKPKPPLKPKPPPRAAATPAPVQKASPQQDKAPENKPIPKGMARCKICSRDFNSDRLEKHETICAKSAQKAKKRKVFDPAKMRTKGTEAEKYVARGEHLKDHPKPKKKQDWRKKHEDFIATVRAAKGIPGYEAPPMDISDYENCPHCGRNFSQGAAERHIPKCSSIKSNKGR